MVMIQFIIIRKRWNHKNDILKSQKRWVLCETNSKWNNIQISGLYTRLVTWLLQEISQDLEMTTPGHFL